MTSQNAYSQIKQHWEVLAQIDCDKDGLRPPARDPFLQRAVEEAIEPWLKPEHRVIDLGCGDGTSTSRFANKVKEIVGVDYIPQYISKSRKNAQSRGIYNASFVCCDILEDDLSKYGVFDVAITIRCLINLANWGNQARAISKIADVIRLGGLFIISEGWSERLRALNGLRKKAGLTEIQPAAYNSLIHRADFLDHIRELFTEIGYENLGFYIIMSRVVQPLIQSPLEPRHDHKINQDAVEMQRYCRRSQLYSEFDFPGVHVFRRI